MAEAEEAEENAAGNNPEPEEDDGAAKDAAAADAAPPPEDGRPAPMSTGDFAVAALDEEKGEQEEKAKDAAGAEAESEEADSSPGALTRIIQWLIHWHPLLFLAGAGALAVYAWSVYPEPESRKVPPAELFYDDGLDRLHRVINPDLPLVAETPGNEALAARNAFLNLFVFHREHLADYPQFINPHLLLAESNRLLAEYTPPLSERYWNDAISAYADAAAWELLEQGEEPGKRAVYVENNFLDSRSSRDIGPLDPDNDEVNLRRARRNDYIAYRRAEVNVSLGRPELARSDLENLRRAEDARRREATRLSVQDDAVGDDIPRHAFELGPDEFRALDFLLAKVYDGLGRQDNARSWYLRYLAAVPEGRNHSFVVERLADISMADGEVYRRANPELAASHYHAAAGYYRELADSSSATGGQHDNAVFGLARANSRLAELVPVGEVAGVDELGALGRGLRSWLEKFSGQELPNRALAIPMAAGKALSSPALLLPGRDAIPEAAMGSLSAMAGGDFITPREQRRVHLTSALENYDRVAEAAGSTPVGDSAAVQAAWAAWDLGLKDDAEIRFDRLIDPLSRPEQILAARLGLATMALDRGELRRAHMLILGGYAHPLPLWFTPDDADWRKIAVNLGSAARRAAPGVWKRVWDVLPDEGREIAGYAASGRRLDDDYVGRLLRALNTVLRRRDLYTPGDFPPRDRNFYLTYLLNRDPELLTAEDIAWRNRLLLEEAWPYEIAHRAIKDNIGFEPFPAGREIVPDGILDPERVGRLLMDLAGRWSTAAASEPDRAERLRMFTEGNVAYQALLDRYGGDPGETLYALARNYESLAEIREVQGNHMAALAFATRAAFSYLDVSFKARGSPREMESLLAAGDAFFRSGLLERTVESQRRFLDRFGYNSLPGTDAALAVVRAENLLGRAYWFLGMTDDALESFRRNVARRTPDRYKSMYYIGRVLMDEGISRNDPELLGSAAKPLPDLDRNGDPIIRTALESFNYLRQSPGINPTARAWRWATFDLARLRYVFADRARREWLAARDADARNAQNAASEPRPDEDRPWVALYDDARTTLTESLERYPLRENGAGEGISIRVEPEDYAETMASRFETEFLLANTLLILAGAREDDSLYSLARAHLENLRDRSRYAAALFDASLDRFQLNAAIIREEVEGGNWDKNEPLPRTRLGDDEGPTHSPRRMNDTLIDSMLLLGNEYFRAGESARERQLLASTESGPAPTGADAGGYYQDSYRVWQDLYDRFGMTFGPQCMVNMGDCLNRLGNREDAANHYRMARNMSEVVPDGGGDPTMLLRAAPVFWGGVAGQRLKDMEDGYNVP